MVPKLPKTKFFVALFAMLAVFHQPWPCFGEPPATTHDRHRSNQSPLPQESPVQISGSLVRQSQVHSLADLERLVDELARERFEPPPAMNPALAALTYDDYRKIGYRPERATWIDQTPFWIETFHRGFVQKDRVELFVRENGINRWIPFSSADFDYGAAGLSPELAAGSGHAGVKVICKFPDQDVQEVLTFLGSSYFRTRNRHAIYGSSVRGLAVDVGLNRPEEFPLFRTFWIEKPSGDRWADPSKQTEPLKLLALLDSPSVVGAYRFELTPGTEITNLDVQARLRFRQAVEKVGIAPLTSMWMWGDGLDGPPKDQRPGVHDSDGLLIKSASTGWIWRPYARLGYPSVSRIKVERLLGFGVMQRNTAFFHYDDHNALYHRRPSVFVTPRGDGWKGGAVELLELSGAHEGVDNIGAYWIPPTPPQPGDQINLDYQVSVFGGKHPDQAGIGQATSFTLSRVAEVIDIEIRFAGESLAEIPGGTQFDFDLLTIRGEVSPPTARKTPTGDWLVQASLKPTEDAPMELRLQVKLDGAAVTEQFVYLCPHDEPQFLYPAVYTRTE